MTGPEARVLVVDDSEVTLDYLGRTLRGFGYVVETALAVAPALELLASDRFDLVITDLRMPGASGLDLLHHVREKLPTTAVMMITGYASIEGAVEAVKAGAEDYLAKPFTDEELHAAVNRVLTRVAAVRAREGGAAARLGLVGASEVMERFCAALERAVEDAALLLLLGEPGSGRSAAARAVVRARGGAGRTLVTIECEDLGGLSPADAKALLADHPLCLRRLEAASRGAQAVVRDMVARAARSRAVLIVCASIDLPRLVRGGVVRGDLWATPASPLVIPPLRERGEDVLLLAEHFLGALAHDIGDTPPRIAVEAGRALLAYAWPGNVAELRSVISVAQARSHGATLELASLPPRIAAAPDQPPQRTLAEAETEHIKRVLNSVGGNKSRAAVVLGIDRKTLRTKLKALDLVADPDR